MCEKPTGVFPSLEWIDYSNNNHGVSVLHQGIPSHEIRDHSIYLTLLRSVVVLSSDGIMGPCGLRQDHIHSDTQHYLMKVIGSRAASYRHGMEINMPLVSIQVTKKIENADAVGRLGMELGYHITIIKDAIAAFQS